MKNSNSLPRKNSPKRMTVLRPLLLLSIALLTLSWTPNTNDFFSLYYQIINDNIKNERYEANIDLIQELKAKSGYQELDCYHKGKLLHKIGVSHYMLLQDDEAVTFYEEVAFNVWKDCPEVPISEMANTLYNLGVSYQYLNNWEPAKKYIDQSLQIIESLRDYPLLDLADKYYGIGNFYSLLNDYFRSQLYYSKALNIYEVLDDTESWRFILLNELIAMDINFKEFHKAKKSIEDALAIYDTYPNEIDPINLAKVYLNAGTTHLELKEYTNARLMANNALELLDELTEPFYYSIGLELVAMIQTEEGKLKEAENNMYRALNLRKALYLKGESQHAIAAAYENLCDILIRQGALARADQHLSHAFDMLLPHDDFDANHLPIIQTSRARDDEQLIRLMELKTKIFEAKYQNSQNVGFLDASLNVQHKIDSIVKRGLLSFQFQQSKLEFLEIRIAHYAKAIKDALRLYDLTNDVFYLNEAYEFSSKTKALVLQQELNRINALSTNTDKETVLEEQALREHMNGQQASLFEADEADKDSILQEYLIAQNRLDAFLQKVEQNQPEYYNQRYKFLKVPTLEETRQRIPKDLAVVEFFVAKDSIYSFWITKTQFFAKTAPFDDAVQDAIDTFVSQCNSPLQSISPAASQLLFEKTLQEGLQELNGNIDRLSIIPDGPLHTVSFEALSNGNNFVINDYAVSYAYAAALLNQENEMGQKPQWEYVGFGAEYSQQLNEKLKTSKRFFGDELLGQLTMSRQEIEDAAAIFKGVTFVNEEASLSNFFSHASKAKIIHLSLHGLVDFDDPYRSAVIFDDSEEVYLLSPQDLYKNRLNAELVLLSACHSASGKIYQGEGVQGMSKAFLLGGAQNILSSLWNATETSSLLLTNSFLKNIKTGEATDIALQKAKLNYLETATPSQQHPYYWANFIILGEVDSIYPKENSLYLWMGIGVLVLGFIFFLLFRNQMIFK
ncbi:CHAT domain-containing protein [Flagellimonas meridianipacifica]|uniref:CHAT domain-containing protein n=2 Tax=Flagellimonas meridianipacifica TaxID=1080225 RepID=A0A2T0MBS0_9FLAO|nr:CHAT domain-containing protein [Allomuricauda pacifica]